MTIFLRIGQFWEGQYNNNNESEGWRHGSNTRGSRGSSLGCGIRTTSLPSVFCATSWLLKSGDVLPFSGELSSSAMGDMAVKPYRRLLCVCRMKGTRKSSLKKRDTRTMASQERVRRNPATRKKYKKINLKQARKRSRNGKPPGKQQATKRPQGGDSCSWADQRRGCNYALAAQQTSAKNRGQRRTRLSPYHGQIPRHH